MAATLPKIQKICLTCQHLCFHPVIHNFIPINFHIFCMIHITLHLHFQCSLSSTISRVCTYYEASSCKTNSPMCLYSRYQVKRPKELLTKEICLLLEATTYICPHTNRLERFLKVGLFYLIHPANSKHSSTQPLRLKSGSEVKFKKLTNKNSIN